MPSANRVYVFTDIETTGLDLVKHGIVQIGSWATGEALDDFYGYFVEDANPYETPTGALTGIETTKEALDVNGFTSERILHADYLDKVLCRWASWIARLAVGFTTNLSVPLEGPINPADGRDVTLVFHNAQFDSPRIQIALARAGLQVKQFRRVLCTVSLGFAATGQVMSQKRLLEHCRKTNHMGHDALGDAYGCAMAFHAIRETLNRPRNDGLISSFGSSIFGPTYCVK